MPARERSPRSEKLGAYRAKRAAGATPEPFGSDAERPGIFVVQQHAARRLHYDFRLEIGGVLRSWAVPKGPSLDPADKRLAVATEDHPVEYADFEGVIPAGNYGAGAVIVWDRGLAVHELDPEKGVEAGKLLFELRGHKLRGLWTLVKTKRGEREWLLIKKPDAAASGESADDLGAESVFSGLSVAELADGNRRADEIREELARLRAPRRRLRLAKVKPMLARLEARPFTRTGWLFELKYDGYRVIASREVRDGGRARSGLRYRSGRDATGVFPDLARALAALPYSSLVMDGEAVVLDEHARPSFGLLQQRARLARPRDLERAALRLPATLFLFDLLGFEDFDLRPLPLVERKRLLARVLPQAGPLRYADHVERRGEDLFSEVRHAGLEGIVAKRADSAYRGRRSASWLKIRAARTGDFAVVGFTLPKGSRTGFGALHLGVLAGGRLLYAGRVGSGFASRQLAAIRARLEPDLRSAPSFAGKAPAGSEHRWVEPRLVVEVRYSEWTRAAQLRHPVFLGLREDKRLEDCERDDLPPEAEPEPSEAAAAGPAPEVEVSRPGKVFWPDEGYTKGDLVAYYRAVARWLLPYLRDRPLVLDRYPDGIRGKSFFQKHAPDFTPGWVRTASIWSENASSETLFFVCDDVETLVYLVNLGTIPIHVWASRAGEPQRPDWSVLDIDAKEAPFAQAVEVAKTLRRLCQSIGLPSFVKTSGATGLHVLVPLGGRCTFAQARQLAEILGRLAVAELPEIASLARSRTAREGRVYIDCLQNGYGKLLVAPLSARPLPGAPVSMPLSWREVGPRLDPRKYTIRSAPARLKRLKREPLAPVLASAPDLEAALARLADRL